MEETQQEMPKKRGKIAHAMTFLGLLSVYLVEGAMDAVHEYLRIIAREKEVFMGAALVLIGVLNFNAGRFCDGNTADYLSCTRPATFYSFGAVDISLIILGVFLILVWFLKRRD